MQGTPRGRRSGIGLAVFVALCIACLGWPLFPLAARAFPARPFGLPFALVWSVVWMLATFVTVGLYHLAAGGEDGG